MQTHVRVVAALFLAFGGLLAAGALLAALLFGGVGALVGAVGTVGDDAAFLARLLLQLTGAALIIVLLGVSIPSLLCGWGLLRHRRWARTLGIVLAAIALVNFWIGTVFGVYALWVLLSKRTEVVFGD